MTSYKVLLPHAFWKNLPTHNGMISLLSIVSCAAPLSSGLKCVPSLINHFLMFSLLCLGINITEQLSVAVIMITVITTLPGVHCSRTELVCNSLWYCYDQNSRQLTLSLFVFWIFTDNSDASFSFNDFAFFANRFN